jgi:hypothetical protein
MIAGGGIVDTASWEDITKETTLFCKCKKIEEDIQKIITKNKICRWNQTDCFLT